MTIDSSALVAIMLDEPERALFVSLILQAGRKVVSSVTVLETSMVCENRLGEAGGLDLDRFLEKARVEVIPFDKVQLAYARIAFRRFGKGRHPAALNFGDCAAYGLAVWSGEPLLFKGADFAGTDVPRVPYVT